MTAIDLTAASERAAEIVGRFASGEDHRLGSDGMFNIDPFGTYRDDEVDDVTTDALAYALPAILRAVADELSDLPGTRAACAHLRGLATEGEQ